MFESVVTEGDERMTPNALSEPGDTITGSATARLAGSPTRRVCRTGPDREI